MFFRWFVRCCGCCWVIFDLLNVVLFGEVVGVEVVGIDLLREIDFKYFFGFI